MKMCSVGAFVWYVVEEEVVVPDELVAACLS